MSDSPILHGLHHVTAVTADARVNHDFYTRILGLRLVKKTVNQDDVSAYHLFYADEAGRPGTEMTFFEWPQTTRARQGTGAVTETALRVAGGPGALARWTAWFEQKQVPHGGIESATATAPASLAFQDFEGQHLRLLAPSTDVAAAVPARRGIPAGLTVLGLGAVTLTVANVEATTDFLTEVLGFRANAGDTALLETGPGGPGAQLRVHSAREHGYGGVGGVHHVAWLVRDLEEQRAWQQQLARHQVGNSGLVDRFYFQSLYFRVPGNILFEIATAGPGFTADGESLAQLGERLSLPPFLENQRARIEAGLRPLDTAAAE